jgi:predicted ArsR family transcriptional regulator
MHKANGFTRQEILTAVKLNGSMTADDLGKELGISPVAVRQHLGALEAEGLITTTVERRGLGRPVHRYSVTAAGDETFPRDYDGLANSLLDELRYSAGEDAVAQLFAARRQRLVSDSQRDFDGKTLDARVHELARIQTGRGYMALATKEEDGFRLTEHNCAICKVARSQPAACAEEMKMITELLGTAVVVRREKHILSGDTSCSYHISEEAVPTE